VSYCRRVLRGGRGGAVLFSGRGDPNLRDDRGDTPLHAAAARGDLDVARLLMRAVRTRLSAHADCCAPRQALLCVRAGEFKTREVSGPQGTAALRASRPDEC
jgi:ankyrin repeat protein